MRESSLYLNFFKKNFVIIFLPTLVGLIVGSWLFLTQPVLYKGTLNLYISDSNNLIDKSLIADQVVSHLRAEWPSFNSFKAGPDVVAVEVIGESNLTMVLDKVVSYSKQIFPVEQLGGIYQRRVDQFYLIFLGPLAAGFLMGIFMALVKIYFKEF